MRETLQQPHEFMENNSSWGVTPRKPDEPKADLGSNVDEEICDTSNNDKSTAQEPSIPVQTPTSEQPEIEATSQSNAETQPSATIQTPKAKSDASLVEITDQLFSKAKSNGKDAVRRFQLVRTLAADPSVRPALGLPEGASRADVKALVDTIDSAQGTMVTREEFDVFVRRIRVSDPSTSPDPKSDADTKTNVNLKPENDTDTVASASTDGHDTNANPNSKADTVLPSDEVIHEAREDVEQQRPDSPQDMQYCAKLVDDCLAGINALARACLSVGSMSIQTI